MPSALRVAGRASPSRNAAEQADRLERACRRAASRSSSSRSLSSLRQHRRLGRGRPLADVELGRPGRAGRRPRCGCASARARRARARATRARATSERRFIASPRIRRPSTRPGTASTPRRRRSCSRSTAGRCSSSGNRPAARSWTSMSSLRFWPITASTLPSLALSRTLARCRCRAARSRCCASLSPASSSLRRERVRALSSRRASAMSASISGCSAAARLSRDRLRGACRRRRRALLDARRRPSRASSSRRLRPRRRRRRPASCPRACARAISACCVADLRRRAGADPRRSAFASASCSCSSVFVGRDLRRPWSRRPARARFCHCRDDAAARCPASSCDAGDRVVAAARTSGSRRSRATTSSIGARRLGADLLAVDLAGRP